MKKIVDGIIVEMAPEEVAAWEAEQATYTPPAASAYRLFKSTFIRRMTSAEADVMEGVLAQADAKLRLLFNSVEYFVSDDELFSDLRDAVASSLSEQRADELLAPEV